MPFGGFCSLPSHPLLSTVYQCDGYPPCLERGVSWLGCQVFPATGAVSILELAATSRSSRMSQAPNLHRATQLFNAIYQKVHLLIFTQDLFSINNATHPVGIMFQAAFLNKAWRLTWSFFSDSASLSFWSCINAASILDIVDLSSSSAASLPL